MSLDQRLRDARDDYRALTPPATDDDAVGVDDGGRPPARSVGRRRLLAVAAAAVLIAGAVGTWAATRDDDPDRVRAADPASTAEGATTSLVPVPGSTGVALDPPGPYRDRQEVVVRVDPDLAEGADLVNEGLSLCATVVVGGDRSETCDPTVDDLVDVGSVGPTSATVRLRRAVFTDQGRRDCNDPDVDCRIVVLAGDGSRHRSERLTFVADPVGPSEASLRVESTGDAGGFTITPEGLAADPSWLAMREEDPERADGFTALSISQCAFGASLGPTPGPFGDPPPWETGDADGVVCGTLGRLPEIDPDRPDAPLTVVLPTLVYGYGGWADCRVDQCYLDVRRTIIQGIEPGGGTLGSDTSAATALLPRDATWGEPVRPTLTIDTPGPHRAGEVVAVTVAGLPEGERRLIGQCSVDQPWGCGYDLLDVGNGTHEVTLHPALLDRCRPEGCYLELDSSSEGLPPLAVAPLDTAG